MSGCVVHVVTYANKNPLSILQVDVYTQAGHLKNNTLQEATNT